MLNEYEPRCAPGHRITSRLRAARDDDNDDDDDRLAVAPDHRQLSQQPYKQPRCPYVRQLLAIYGCPYCISYIPTEGTVLKDLLRYAYGALTTSARRWHTYICS
eukprot:COSAG02_NODE_634_length_19259_cov_9.871347_11_plen_104_part_00